jgi:hypothetical protein
MSCLQIQSCTIVVKIRYTPSAFQAFNLFVESTNPLLHCPVYLTFTHSHDWQCSQVHAIHFHLCISGSALDVSGFIWKSIQLSFGEETWIVDADGLSCHTLPITNQSPNAAKQCHWFSSFKEKISAACCEINRSNDSTSGKEIEHSEHSFETTMNRSNLEEKQSISCLGSD